MQTTSNVKLLRDWIVPHLTSEEKLGFEVRETIEGSDYDVFLGPSHKTVRQASIDAVLEGNSKEEFIERLLIRLRAKHPLPMYGPPVLELEDVQKEITQVLARLMKAFSLDAHFDLIAEKFSYIEDNCTRFRAINNDLEQALVKHAGGAITSTEQIINSLRTKTPYLEMEKIEGQEFLPLEAENIEIKAMPKKAEVTGRSKQFIPKAETNPSELSQLTKKVGGSRIKFAQTMTDVDSIKRGIEVLKGKTKKALEIRLKEIENA